MVDLFIDLLTHDFHEIKKNLPGFMTESLSSEYGHFGHNGVT